MANDSAFLSMFLLGFFGTGHCIGMCGPLVVALPGRYECWYAHAIYHAGRVATYTLMGAILGGIGHGLVALFDTDAKAALLWTSRVQIAISLPVAGFLMFMGLARLGLYGEPQWMVKAMPQKIPGYGTVLTGILNRRSALWLLGMGLLLGLLPCGLSYGAFARALAAQSMIHGALMTLLFGLGTLPGLLLLGTGAARLFHRYRARMDLISGLIMIGMGVSLVVQAGSAFL